jgi:hypothetical protein
MGRTRSIALPTRSATAIEGAFRTALDEQRRSRNDEDTGRLRNVFLSFHTVDSSQVNLLRSQARNPDFGMEFRDYSIKEPFDEAWKSNCRERIGLTSTTIVMIGPETSTREAVLWEIGESYRQGHKVIGVRIYRDRNDPVPSILTKHNAPIVNWDRDAIRQELGMDG